MYLAPVFTGLEYASFAAFGVGTWQARLVSEAMGTISVIALALGVAATAGRRAGLIAAALLATNYIYVMWDRAALMEATMTAFMAIAWSCIRVRRKDGVPRFGLKPHLHIASASLGLVAGIAAWLAFFTKAAAAFFVGALGLEALLTLWLVRQARGSAGAGCAREGRRSGLSPA